MPWKGIKDPYKIWLSEVILQQTRVDQGEKYYHAFIKNYPSVSALAKAPEEEVLRLWQGLGYYNRCRNLLATANIIDQEYHGVFPADFDTILKLKGIGEYTAAAIASFAFNQPYAVVDGNVVRVLSRVFGLTFNFFETKGKREFQVFAQTQLDKKEPGKYNQAIMDFGATICKPQQPLCHICPFIRDCYAFQHQQIDELPVKKIRKALKERSFHFFVMYSDTSVYLVKREKNDIWKGLHTMYAIESKRLLKKNLPDFLKEFTIEKPIICHQVLSHQKITGYFYKIKLRGSTSISAPELLHVKKTELHKYAFPKLILSFFEKIDYL